MQSGARPGPDCIASEQPEECRRWIKANLFPRHFQAQRSRASRTHLGLEQLKLFSPHQCIEYIPRRLSF